MEPTVSTREILFILEAVRSGVVSAGFVMDFLSTRQGENEPIGEHLVRVGALTLEQYREIDSRLDLQVAPTKVSDSKPDLQVSDTRKIESKPDLQVSDTKVLPGSWSPGQPDTQSLDGPETVGSVDELLERIGRDQPGHFTIVSEHGRGGHAKIYRAVDQHIGREVAVKILLEQHAEKWGSRPTRVKPPPSIMRFVREARVTGQLEHPNIVPVHELGVREDGSVFYAMRLVRGETLARRLSQCRTLTDRLKLLGSFWDVCNAVAYAHSNGVVHRDLKPENTMVGQFGETVVLDWGIAKVRGERDEGAGDIKRQLSILKDSGITVDDGMAIGTPRYMSPEQVMGRIGDIDERSDVWGLGAMLYELLTGEPPFEGELVVEVFEKVASAPLRSLGEVCPGVPPELAAVATRALKKKREERYQSASELAAEVSAFMTGGRVQAYSYSSWELLRRFAARNKAAVTAAGLVLLVVLASLVVVTHAYRKEAIAHQREHVQRLEAKLSLAEAYLERADRLYQERRELATRIFAAASLRHNPTESFPRRGRGPSSGARHVRSSRLKTRAASLLFGTEERYLVGLERIIERQGNVPDLAFTSDGDLVWVDYDGSLVVWDLAKGEIKYEVQDAHPGKIYCLALSNDGNLLATAGRDGFVRVWKRGSTEPVLSLRPPDEIAIPVVAFSPDNRLLASGSRGTNAWLWDSETGNLVRSFEGHQGEVWGLAFSPDGRRLATGSWDEKAMIWDVATAKVQHILTGHSDGVAKVAFSGDGTRLVTSSYDATVGIWDTSKGSRLAVLRGHEGAVYRALFSPNDQLVASVGLDRRLVLWDPVTGDMLSSLIAHNGGIRALAFSPDGKQLATGSYDRSIRIWNLATPSVPQRLPVGQFITSVMHDHGATAVASLVRKLTVWGDDSQPRQILGDPRGPFSLALAPDGKTLAVGERLGDVHLVRWPSGEHVATLSGHEDTVLDLTWFPDGRRLLTGSSDNTGRIWDVEERETQHVLVGHDKQVLGVAVSPDAKAAVTVSEDGTARIWDPRTGVSTQRLDAHSDWVTAVAFSPGGELLVTASKDRSVILWDTAGFNEVQRLSGHEERIKAILFSGDGRRLITAARDGRAIIWDRTTWEPTLVIRESAGFQDAFLTADGKRLLLAAGKEILIYPLVDELNYDPDVVQVNAEENAGVRLDGFVLHHGVGQN
ncbi:WD40 repeat domain-containing serine/threonine protein kinase [Myxococcota bacterium]